jgi:RNA-binding protein YhbY
MAIKFIGKSGIHNKKSQKRSDLIDSYNLIKRVLDKLYDNSDEHLKKISRTINMRKKQCLINIIGHYN